MEWLPRLKAVLARLGTLDLRALALFRIAIATCLLWDVATRLGDFADHYSDAGYVPVELAYELGGRVARLYLPIWSHGSDLVVMGLFGLLVACALALLVGFHTRIASVACWLLLVSLQVRNPLVASFGGDTVLRVALFWAMLLPLGGWYSLDARRAARGGGERATRLLSAASVALVAQVTLLYVTTGLAKYGGTWLNGSALYYALHVDYFGNGLGAWLREREALLPVFSYATLWFERYGPILLFVPFATDVFRLLAVVLFVGFHLGLALFMDVGPFPLYTMALWPAFLPSAFFDDWLPRLRAQTPRPPAGDPWLRQHVAGQLFAAIALVFVIGHVATHAERWRDPGRRLPSPLVYFGKLFQLQQDWDMFGPNPPQRDIWPLIAGEYEDGSRLDLLSGEPYEPHKPEDMPAYLGSFRARLYFRALYWNEPPLPIPKLHAGYANAHCRRAADEGSGLRAVHFRVGVEDTRVSGDHPIVYPERGRITCP